MRFVCSPPVSYPATALGLLCLFSWGDWTLITPLCWRTRHRLLVQRVRLFASPIGLVMAHPECGIRRMSSVPWPCCGLTVAGADVNRVRAHDRVVLFPRCGLDEHPVLRALLPPLGKAWGIIRPHHRIERR